MNRLFVCLVLFAPLGCIRAPEIVLVDRATALEQQAAGSFDDLEKKLTRVGVAPKPVPLTPDQLAALGIQSTPLVDNSDQTDADRLDGLLRQHCVGEARDGRLVETHRACRGAVDRAQAQALIEQVNRARAQLWRWLRAQRPESTPDDLQRAWWKAHRRGVVCGGWIQRDDGGWEEKTC